MSLDENALGYAVSVFIVSQLASYIFVQRYADLVATSSGGHVLPAAVGGGGVEGSLNDAFDVDVDAEMIVLAGSESHA